MAQLLWVVTESKGTGVAVQFPCLVWSQRTQVWQTCTFGYKYRAWSSTTVEGVLRDCSLLPGMEPRMIRASALARASMLPCLININEINKNYNSNESLWSVLRLAC